MTIQSFHSLGQLSVLVVTNGQSYVIYSRSREILVCVLVACKLKAPLVPALSIFHVVVGCIFLI